MNASGPPASDRYTLHLLARLNDFFAEDAVPWPRRLWVERLAPLGLAARAEVALKLVGGETDLSVVDLLEPRLANQLSA